MAATIDTPKRLRYAVTTEVGFIPYITDSENACFTMPRIVLLDDFLYYNSFYDRNLDADLKNFIGADGEVFLMFRDPKPCKKTRQISSKRGVYRVTEDRYKAVLRQMRVEKFADFTTGELTVDGAKVVEPSTLSEYVPSDDVIYGTRVLNELSSKGFMVFIEDGKLVSRHLNETDHEYEKWMYSINEMNAFTFVAESNYRALLEYSRLQ